MLEILVGDCVEQMRLLPEKSVQTCITSPPYFGLRDYGVAGQVGHEQTPTEYVARLVEVFREVRRVLRDDGTVWLNLGDSYAGSGKGGNPSDSAFQTQASNVGSLGGKPVGTFDGIKSKDLIGIPWSVALALRDDGWYLRRDIIWHKPNPMPESVRDRCTTAHEYLFMLSKSPKYYFDSEANKEPGVVPAGTKGAKGSADRAAQKGVNSRPPEYKVYDGLRNRRSVWTVTAKPFKGAHFATFPPDLIEPCILTGSPLGGTVLDPFGGSGTTAGVAVANGRRAILCELNPDYAAMVPARVEAIAGMPVEEIEAIERLI